jgi:hypothetical protein
VGRLPARGSRADGGIPDVAGESAAPAGEHDAAGSGARGSRLSRQGSASSAANEKRRDQGPATDAENGSRASAEGVCDGRLRAAIEAALRPSSQGPPEASGRGTPAG